MSNNIIPDTVEIKGTLRNTDHEVREYVLKRIRKIRNKKKMCTFVGRI